nr:MAG TPA: hypothetical protein [Bacteriophage sp.]
MLFPKALLKSFIEAILYKVSILYIGLLFLSVFLLMKLYLVT